MFTFGGSQKLRLGLPNSSWTQRRFHVDSRSCSSLAALNTQTPSTKRKGDSHAQNCRWDPLLGFVPLVSWLKSQEWSHKTSQPRCNSREKRSFSRWFSRGAWGKSCLWVFLLGGSSLLGVLLFWEVSSASLQFGFRGNTQKQEKELAALGQMSGRVLSHVQP